jgi:two-component system, chemotaxis family, chemotaxis protein CheY
MLSPTAEKGATEKKTRRVLYVDDMRELREVARLALSRAGHQVECAPDGADAFALISAHPEAFDIVISDHHMAGMNGLELVMKLREIKYPGRIAIVSSEMGADIAEEYRRLDVGRILYKPVELSELRALVLEE